MSKKYPTVLTELDTLELAIGGRSIARLGDGELRLALGGQAASQEPNEKLAYELRQLVGTNHKSALVCIPPLTTDNPVMWFWKTYTAPKWLALYQDNRMYGSTWITRPDCAPWIDTDEYWLKIRELWKNKNVTLVTGDEKSLTHDLMHDAATVRTIKGKRQHAYSEIDKIEEQIGKPSGPVLMCFGATATVLAERLAKKNVHAIDLGHLGMFLRRREKKMRLDDVVTPEYAQQLSMLHGSKSWGTSGRHQAGTVAAFAKEIGARTILDYGCGRATLKPTLILQGHKYVVHEYDPGILEKAVMPEPADLVVATDVLEHIEKDRLKNVLHHLKTLAQKGMYLIISCRPAREILPDGRNAHLIVREPEWWTKTLTGEGFNIIRTKIQKGIHVWIKV